MLCLENATLLQCRPFRTAKKTHPFEMALKEFQAQGGPRKISVFLSIAACLSGMYGSSLATDSAALLFAD